ncbi:MAG: PhoU domain-containing protein [Rubricoccaceae bacterium]
MRLLNLFASPRPSRLTESMNELGTMLGTAADMFGAATACLLDNAPITADLPAMDATINAGEQRIRRALLMHVAEDPRDELRLSLLVLSIVQDAERCGDLAKSIAKVAALAARPRMGAYVDALRPLRDRVEAMFPRTRAAFLDADAESARLVMLEHNRLKKDNAAFLQRLAAAPDVSSNEGIVLALGSRMIARTSSHLSNIISAVAMPFEQVRRSPTWGDGAL